ncbi:MAG: hypothetical protein KVP17_003685 [Porospora cf. gigantea B]|uniref:uncharacterized protein n=1 Tax=Porospora cf. gigantea B TaxID=2853592 RepID=UPI003571AAD1|nr:MAG: hypothetical protein KVP17_003685 [Porospora cf. gigantea B]
MTEYDTETREVLEALGVVHPEEDHASIDVDGSTLRKIRRLANARKWGGGGQNTQSSAKGIKASPPRRDRHHGD